MLATFNNGIINSCGCLLLILCNTSKGIIPVGNCLSKLILNMLLVFKFHGVCIEIHMINLLCNVHCLLVFANCPGTGGAKLSARNWCFGKKCLPSQFQVQPILQFHCQGNLRIMTHCRFLQNDEPVVEHNLTYLEL